MDVDPEKIYLRPAEFYETAGIKILTEKCAESLNLEKKQVLLSDGTSLKYDKLVIATGKLLLCSTTEGDCNKV